MTLPDLSVILLLFFDWLYPVKMLVVNFYS